METPWDDLLYPLNVTALPHLIAAHVRGGPPNRSALAHASLRSTCATICLQDVEFIFEKVAALRPDLLNLGSLDVPGAYVVALLC